MSSTQLSSPGARAGKDDYRSFAAQLAHYFARPHSHVPETAIRNTAAWHGSELAAQPQRWQFHLNSEQIDALEHAASECVSALGEDACAAFDANNANAGATNQQAPQLQPERESSGTSDEDEYSRFLTEVNKDNFRLPEFWHNLLERWRANLTNGCGLVLARGFPVERWGDARSALIYWGLGQHLGIPGGQNPDEELLGHVKDYGEEQNNPAVRRYRTSGLIKFHCDAADVVGLLCLRPASSGGASRLASSVTVFNEIYRRDPEVAARLFKPMRLDSRGEQVPGAKPWREIVPSCFDGTTLRTFWHSDYFSTVTRHAQAEPFSDAEMRLLDWVEEIGNQPDLRLDMQFQAGDLQLISNHTILHGRTAFEDDAVIPDRSVGHSSGKQQGGRHLLRLWLSLP